MINQYNSPNSSNTNRYDVNSLYSNLNNSLNTLSNSLFTARVLDIVLNENHPEFNNVGLYNGIGAIFYEIVNQTGTSTTTSLNFALPLNSSLKIYPLINEYVLLFKIPNNQTGLLQSNTSYFYLNPVSIWNHPHCNPYPNPLPSINKLPPSEDLNYPSINNNTTTFQENTPENYTPDSDLNSPNNPSQNTFIEKSNIHMLMPFAGDTIFEGRWGQSIRFGSTTIPPLSSNNLTINNNWSSFGKNGNPITILKNGQPTNSTDEGWIPTTENINKDLSSIYLTSYQKIPFNIANENFISYTTPPISPSQFTNPQIIINSDRIILNAKSDSVLISGQNSIGLSSNKSINLESINEINITSKLTRLGNKNATQSVLRGDETIEYLKILINELQNLAEALKVIQDWPSGAPVPNPVILTVANSALQVFENVYNEIDSVKSKIVKTI